jgi:hypothetical protein
MPDRAHLVAALQTLADAWTPFHEKLCPSRFTFLISPALKGAQYYDDAR